MYLYIIYISGGRDAGGPWKNIPLAPSSSISGEAGNPANYLKISFREKETISWSIRNELPHCRLVSQCVMIVLKGQSHKISDACTWVMSCCQHQERERRVMPPTSMAGMSCHQHQGRERSAVNIMDWNVPPSTSRTEMPCHRHQQEHPANNIKNGNIPPSTSRTDPAVNIKYGNVLPSTLRKWTSCYQHQVWEHSAINIKDGNVQPSTSRTGSSCRQHQEWEPSTVNIKDGYVPPSTSRTRMSCFKHQGREHPPVNIKDGNTLLSTSRTGESCCHHQGREHPTVNIKDGNVLLSQHQGQDSPAVKNHVVGNAPVNNVFANNHDCLLLPRSGNRDLWFAAYGV